MKTTPQSTRWSQTEQIWPALRQAVSRLLFRRTVSVLAFLFAIGILLALGHQWWLQRRLVRSTALGDAARYSEALRELRTLYTSEVVERVRLHGGVEVSHDYKTYGPASIPLPATFSIMLGEQMAAKGIGGQTRLYSPYPFPWREAERRESWDRFAEEAWETLNENPQGDFWRIEEADGQVSLRYATADMMRDSCVDCHNNHPDTPKSDWEVGDVRGVLEVAVPLDYAIAQTWSDLQQSLVVYTGLAAVGLLGLTLVVGRLRRTSDELEERVDQRTRELTESNASLQGEIARRKRLEDQQQSMLAELERANTELRDFAYVVSHDLKAPLRGISSLATWVVEDYHDQLDEEGRENLVLLVDRTRRMDALIDGILQYSRVGRIQGPLETLDSHRVAQEVIDALNPPENISVSIEAALPTVVYDRTHLEQLFQNLISNAIQHLGKPQGHVIVSCRETDSFWEFRVADDGVGIEPRHFDRIFKMFQTLKAREQSGSTGIGLAMVKKIAEEHGGRVGVESAVGEGTTFWFTIPKSLRPQDAASTTSQERRDESK